MLEYKKGICCPFHGVSCPNVREDPHRFNISQPANNAASPIADNDVRINRNLSDDRLLEAVNSKCIIAATYARCCVSRRLAISQNNSAHIFEYDKKIKNPPIEAMREVIDGFNQFINDNIWHIIQDAHVRVKLSIVETYAEIPETAGAAIAANSLIRSLRLARMVTDPKQKVISNPKASEYCKKEGIAHTCLVATDTAKAMLVRLRSILYSHPVLWMIVYSILEHDLQDPKHIFNTADNIKYQRLYHQGNQPSLASEARDILMPSPMNIKYQHLYRTHHIRHKSYGSASHLPEKDESFLLANKCVNVMDFGCGKSKRLHTGNFNAIFFDPSIKEYSKPHRDVVDGIINYDVLEHIPTQGLDVFVKWVAMYQPKCIVLGICTRIAGAVLNNGENAHCTVRNSNWWIKWADQSFKSIYNSNVEIKQIKSNRADYLTLHLCRTDV
jgi:hypothetical protein